MKKKEVIVNGYTRKRHWEDIYHDLADLYGPKIGLDGVGLWFTYKRFIQRRPGHPLEGKSWPSAKGLLSKLFKVGENSLRNARQRLEDVGLITSVSGRSLTADSPSLTMGDLAALGIQNPSRVLIVEVNDPLPFHAFCAKFGLTYGPIAEPGSRYWRMEFDDYPGIIIGPNRLLAAARWIEDNLAVGPDDRPYHPLVTEEQINSLLRCQLDDAETLSIRTRLLSLRARVAGELERDRGLPRDVLAGLQRLGWIGSTVEIEAAYERNPHHTRTVIRDALVIADTLQNPSAFVKQALREGPVIPPAKLYELPY